MHYKRGYNKKGIQTIVAALLMVLIVIIASAMIYSWSLGVFGTLLPAPRSGRELLTIENQGFDLTNKNMTVYLRNTGTAPTTLVSYYLSDLNGDVYAKGSWTVQTIPTAALGKVYILINTACVGCTLSGSAFVFQPGSSYTLTLVTARNTQFSFVILR